MCLLFFFFKQKTAYEMRISDWSSDVCSSDLSASWRSRGRRERKLRDRDEHLRSVAEFHHIASDHRSAGRRERTARYIVKRATRLDQRLFADDALALDLADLPVAVADLPVAIEELRRERAVIFDPDMIGPEPAPERRMRLFGQIADRHAHRDRPRRGREREKRVEHRQHSVAYSPTLVNAWSRSAIRSRGSSSPL